MVEGERWRVRFADRLIRFMVEVVEVDQERDRVRLYVVGLESRKGAPWYDRSSIEWCERLELRPEEESRRPAPAPAPVGWDTPDTRSALEKYRAAMMPKGEDE